MKVLVSAVALCILGPGAAHAGNAGVFNPMCAERPIMHRVLARAHALVMVLSVALVGLPARGPSAQGMMDHVDFNSPRMSEAELTRAQVEALLAEAGPGRPADLSDKGLNG